MLPANFAGLMSNRLQYYIPVEVETIYRCKRHAILSAISQNEQSIWISRFPFPTRTDFINFTNILVRTGFLIYDVYGAMINETPSDSWYDYGYEICLIKDHPRTNKYDEPPPCSLVKE